jgi:hypothetical protein
MLGPGKGAGERFEQFILPTIDTVTIDRYSFAFLAFVSTDISQMESIPTALRSVGLMVSPNDASFHVFESLLLVATHFNLARIIAGQL